MRPIFLLMALCCCQIALAQAWVPVQMDARMTVALPAPVRELDTLGSKNWFGTMADCQFSANKLTRTTAQTSEAPLHSEQELRKHYDELIAGVKALAPAMGEQVKRHEIREINGLLWLVHFVSMNKAGQILEQEAWTLRLLDATYTFYFTTTAELLADSAMQQARQKFYDGIQVDNGLTRADQYTQPEASSESSGPSRLMWMVIVLAVAIPLLIWLAQRERAKKRVQSGPQNNV